jgi:hypothetical protein
MRCIIYLIIALSLLTGCSFAADPPTFKVFKVAEANSYRVIYANPSSELISLEVMNSRKQTLYRSEYRASRGIKLPLDFSALKNGRYFVSIRNGGDFFIQEIDHVQEIAGFAFHAAPLNSDPQKYLISIIVPTHSSITLSVYDVCGKRIHQQYQTIRKQEALVLNLREFKGPFVFELTDPVGKKRAVRR